MVFTVGDKMFGSMKQAIKETPIPKGTDLQIDLRDKTTDISEAMCDEHGECFVMLEEGQRVISKADMDLLPEHNAVEALDAIIRGE